MYNKEHMNLVKKCKKSKPVIHFIAQLEDGQYFGFVTKDKMAYIGKLHLLQAALQLGAPITEFAFGKVSVPSIIYKNGKKTIGALAVCVL